MATATPPDTPGSGYGSSSNERIILQLLHWTVVLVIIIAVLIMRVRNDIDNANVGVIYATALGHAGNAANQRLRNRQAD